MREVVDEIDVAFRDTHAGRIETPARQVLGGGKALVMSARDDTGTVLKGVTVHPENRGARSVIQGVTVWFDGETGSPRAIVHGGTLTTMRTGAASGVATRHLADPDAHTLGLIGAGGQALDQARAVCSVRSITDIRIASRSRGPAEAARDELAAEFPGCRVTVAPSIAEAVNNADVVCTATTSSTALFSLEDVPGRCHINAIGAHTAEMCELSPAVIEAASVVTVDSLDAAAREAGDLIQAVAAGRMQWSGVHEIGELLTKGTGPSGRITVFKSVGIAAQDLALCRLVVERAASSKELPTFDFDLEPLVLTPG